MDFKNYNKQEKFSIRKYKSVGAASALIGALFLVGGTAVYASDEQSPNITNISTVEKQVAKDSEPTVEKQVAKDSEPTVEKQVAKDSEPTVEKQVAKDSEPTVEKQVAKDSEPTVEKQVAKDSEPTVEKQVAKDSEPTVEKQVAKDSEPTVEKQVAKDSEPTVEKQVAKDSEPTVEKQVAKDSEPTVEKQVAKDSEPTVEKQVAKDSEPTVEKQVAKDSEPTVEKQVAKDSEPTVEKQVAKDSEPTVEKQVAKDSEPTVEKQVAKDSEPTVEKQVAKDSEPTVEKQVAKDSEPTVEKQVAKDSEPTVEKQVAKDSEPTVEKQVAKDSEPTVEKQVAKDSEPTVEKQVAKDSEPTVEKQVAKDSEPTVEKQVAKDSEPTVEKQVAKDSEPTVEKQVAKDSEPTVEKQVAKDSEPVRSKRSKRDVSRNNIGIINVPYDYDNRISMDGSNLTEVSRIDYSTSNNPASERENEKGIYNNQIESIEEIPANDKGTHRYRVKLKDGLVIPSGGKIVLATLGGGSPTSTSLIKGSDTIGSISELDYNYREPNSMGSRLKNTTTVDEYISTFEGMTKEQQNVKALVLRFNSEFSKLNNNRVIEFELEKKDFKIVDLSLIRRSEQDSGKSILDSKGVAHKLTKILKSYFMNPYDSKIIPIDDVENYITTLFPPRATRVSNDMSMLFVNDRLYSDVPSYFGSVRTPHLSMFRVLNHDSISDKKVASIGDTFKFELPENSLFATSKYSVGDIVTLSGNDNVLAEKTISGSRFTDTDEYVTVNEPKTSDSENRIIKARFKLVEKTDRSYKWELLDNISLANEVFEMYTSGTLTPVALRHDWVSRFGEEKLKQFLSGDERYVDKYLNNGELSGTMTSNINGVENIESYKGSITKNTNLVTGENTTGTVKVIHKTDTGTVLREETVAQNQPWYKPLNIDPSNNFTGYVFKSSSAALFTIVGSGDKVIELIYTQPKTVTKEIPPKVTYVVDNSKDGTYRNEVVGKPSITTTTTTYVYNETTRTASEKTTETVTDGKPTVVTLGSKPTKEVTYQNFNTRYVVDETRTAGEKVTETQGVRGSTTIETTYSVNTETGVVTPTKGQPVVTAPKDEVIKVGTKPVIQTTVISKNTFYQEDRDAAFESKTTLSEGHDGSTTTTTTYTLNEQNGEVTSSTKTETVEKEDKIVKVGSVRTENETLPKTVRYQGNSDIDFGKKELQVEGQDGEILVKYIYTVSPIDGSLSNPVRSATDGDVGGMLPDIYWVGNKKEDRKETPIITRYEADPEKPFGEEEVVSQGVLGVHTTTTLYTVNETTGELSDPRVSETDVPMEPKVIKVGTKEKVVTKVLEPEVEYVKDPTREKGSENIVTPGPKGSEVTTTTYTVDPKTGKVTENVGKPVVTPAGKTIVKVGTKEKVVTKVLEPEVEYVKDPTREKGSENIVTPGPKGSEVTTTTYTVDPKTGKVTENVGKPVVTPAGKTIVKVGTKEKVVTKVLEPEVEYVKDPTREKGSENIVTPGPKGSEVTTTTYTVDPKTGKVTENVGKPVVTPAGKTIVKVGTKEKVVTKVLEPEVEYVKDPTREKGSENIVTPGPKGSEVTTTTYTVDPKTGKVTENVGKPVVTPAGKTIVKVGTKEKVVTKVLEPEVEYVKDPTREKGSENIVTPGPKGSEVTTTTYTVDPKTGKVTENVGKPVVTPAGKTIVKVGTKEKVVTKVLEPEVEYVKDPTREKGSENIVTPGPKGSEVTITTYTVDPKTGKVTENVGKPVVTPAGKTIVKVGTKEKVVTKVLEPEVEYVKDPTREKGSENIVTPGPKGSEVTTTTYTVDPKTGKVTENVGKPVVTPAGKTIVKVGTKEKVVTKVLEPEVEYVKDPTREKGSENIVTPGPKGSEVTITTYTVDPKTGKVTENVGKPVVTPAGKTIVKVGTKEKVVTKVLEPEVEYVKDPTREKGSENIVTPGPKGSEVTITTYTVDPKTGKVTENVGKPVVTPAGKTIVKVGTKEKVVTKVLEPEVEYVKDPTREKGSENIVTPGPKGSEVTTTTYTVDPKTGKVTENVGKPVVTPAGKTIVKVGTKEKVVTKVLEPEVEYVKDPTREKGSENIVTPGPKGSEVTITTYTVDPKTGKVTENVGKPVVTPAGKTIVKVGTKEKVVTKVLEPEVEYVKDPTREKGSENIVTPGPKGSEVTTTTYTVDPKTGKVTENVGKPVVTPAGKTIVKVGTKEKVVTKVLEPEVEYVKDPTREKGSENIVTPGPKGSEVTTTTYTVDPKTGKVTENVGKPVVTPAGKTIVKVGTKEKVVTKVLEPEVEYVKDPTREKGSENIVTPGPKGSEVTTTTYTVDPKTGKVTENVGKPVVTPAGKTIVKVGTKEKIERIEDSEKIIERRTTYDVHPKTGEISSQVTARIIKRIDKTPTAELKVEASTGASVAKGLGPVVQEKVLPNTGADTTNTAGLGFGVIAAGAVMVKQRRKLGKRQI